MSGFQLLFRRSGRRDTFEIRHTSDDDPPRMNGRPIVDGATYTIRGEQWVLRRVRYPAPTPTYLCTPLEQSEL